MPASKTWPLVIIRHSIFSSTQPQWTFWYLKIIKGVISCRVHSSHSPNIFPPKSQSQSFACFHYFHGWRWGSTTFHPFILKCWARSLENTTFSSHNWAVLKIQDIFFCKGARKWKWVQLSDGFFVKESMMYDVWVRNTIIVFAQHFLYKANRPSVKNTD